MKVIDYEEELRKEREKAEKTQKELKKYKSKLNKKDKKKKKILKKRKELKEIDEKRTFKHILKQGNKQKFQLYFIVILVVMLGVFSITGRNYDTKTLELNQTKILNSHEVNIKRVEKIKTDQGFDYIFYIYNRTKYDTETRTYVDIKENYTENIAGNLEGGTKKFLNEGMNELKISTTKTPIIFNLKFYEVKDSSATNVAYAEEQYVVDFYETDTYIKEDLSDYFEEEKPKEELKKEVDYLQKRFLYKENVNKIFSNSKKRKKEIIHHFENDTYKNLHKYLGNLYQEFKKSYDVKKEELIKKGIRKEDLEALKSTNTIEDFKAEFKRLEDLADTRIKDNITVVSIKLMSNNVSEEELEGLKVDETLISQNDILENKLLEIYKKTYGKSIDKIVNDEKKKTSEKIEAIEKQEGITYENIK